MEEMMKEDEGRRVEDSQRETEAGRGAARMAEDALARVIQWINRSTGQHMRAIKEHK